MKNYYLLILFVGLSFSSQAQVGIGTAMPNGSAQLDVVATNKGVLITRVALTGKTDATTILGGNVNSLLVFNTATVGLAPMNVTPGYYYWYTNEWVRLASGNGFTETITTLVDNGNGTVTYTNETGVPVVVALSPGPQGPQGPAGIPGADGATGAQGIQGLTGADGAVGATGAQGIQGLTGADGAVGATGAQGIQGLAGADGAVGAQGIQGVTGADGAVGATGAQGIQGVAGADGAVGATGAQGIQGLTGADGAVGATGAQGIQGLAGADGALGAQGIQGVAGDDGAVGATGAQGIQGVAGADGATGAQGIQGLTGADGAVGATGAQGIQGLAGADGAVGATGAQGIQGVAGADGATGAQGIQGLTGADGAVGATGVQGIQGVAGADGQGGVTTGGTNVTITGTGTVASPYVVNASTPATINTTLAFAPLTNVLSYTNENNNNPTIDLSALKIEPWRDQQTLTAATNNTQSIYQLGNVAINKSANAAGTSLDVQGAARIGSYAAGYSIGSDSFAAGYNNVVSGEQSAAFGSENKIISDPAATNGYIGNSFIAGRSNTINTFDAVALGSWNVITYKGRRSIAAGENSYINDENAIAIGYSTEIRDGGKYGFVAGRNSVVEGNTAVAMGYGAFALGDYSFSRGLSTTANSYVETAIGTFNAIRTSTKDSFVLTDPLFQIGNGIDASQANLSNAMTVLKNGAVGINIAGQDNAAKPTETLDIGSGNVRVRDINSSIGAATDKMVVADANGVLKTVPVPVAGAAVEPWQVVGTTNLATTNTQNIYQNGSVGLGDFTTTGPLANLDVRGAVRGGTPSPEELNFTSLIGLNSVAFGTNNNSAADNTAVFGFGNSTGMHNTFIMGVSNTIERQGYSSSGSALFGTQNILTTSGGGAEMQNNTIFGYNNKMDTAGSGPFGFNNNTIFGQNNKILSGGSPNGNITVFGKNNFADVSGASVTGTTIFGENNIANQNNQFVIGTANLNPNNALFEIGNGPNATTRSNVMTVTQDKVMVGSHTELPNSTLQIAGSLSVNVVTVSGSYTVLPTDYIILVEGASAVGYVITLPDPTTCKGRLLILKSFAQDVSSFTVQTPVGFLNSQGDLGISNTTVTATGTFVSNGVDWYVLYF